MARQGVTGHKNNIAKPDVPRAAYTIPEFCITHRMSESTTKSAPKDLPARGSADESNHHVRKRSGMAQENGSCRRAGASVVRWRPIEAPTGQRALKLPHHLVHGRTEL
jgi:hypothetical protein